MAKVDPGEWTEEDYEVVERYGRGLPYVTQS